MDSGQAKVADVRLEVAVTELPKDHERLFDILRGDSEFAATLRDVGSTAGMSSSVSANLLSMAVVSIPA
jgi:hypothetical protein